MPIPANSLALQGVSDLFCQDDQLHLGHCALSLFKKIYPDIDVILNFYLKEHSEFILHSRHNAARRFPDHQGIAARVLTQHEPFDLSTYDDVLTIISDIDTPGCTSPHDIFAAPGYYKEELVVVVTTYADQDFPPDFNHDLVLSLADIIAKAHYLLIEKKQTNDFCKSLPHAYASAIEQRSSKTLGINERLHSYIDALAQQVHLSAEALQSLHLAASLQFTGYIQSPKQLITAKVSHEIQSFNNSFVSKLPFPDSLVKTPLIISQLRENFDGTGEPLQLLERKISLGSRILRLVTSFEFILQSVAHDTSRALALLENESGLSLDPELLALFIDKKCYEIPKRTSERFELTFPVDLQLLSNTVQKKYSALAHDLSETGLKITSEDYFAVEEIVEVTMYLPAQSISVLAMVVRDEKSENKHTYGLHILNR